MPDSEHEHQIEYHSCYGMLQIKMNILKLTEYYRKIGISTIKRHTKIQAIRKIDITKYMECFFKLCVLLSCSRLEKVTCVN